MSTDRNLTKPAKINKRLLTAPEFQGLAEIPPEAEWFANLSNENTRRAYKNDIQDFMRFVGIQSPAEFRLITRAHVIAYRDELEHRELAGQTIRRSLSALSSLFDHLANANAILLNPVDGVKRPSANANEGSTPALSDSQARQLLDAPAEDTIKGLRDRAILATLLYHGIRRAELCSLRVKDVLERKGVPHLRIRGKGDKLRYLPLHPAAQERIRNYLAAIGHETELNRPLFRPVRVPNKGSLNRPLNPNSIYQSIVRKYAIEVGVSDKVAGIGVHSLRATAATNALDNDSDITKVQEWLGHANISTTRLYDRRRSKPEDSPTFRVKY